MPEQSFEKTPIDPTVVSSSIINGPNRRNRPVIFSAEDMASSRDHLEVYLADDPNPVEIYFPTEDFVAFRREVSTDQVFSKGSAEIDLLDSMYPEGPGSQVDDHTVSISLGRGRDNFGGLGDFETPGVSRKHCQISFDLVNKTLIIENFENTTNRTEVVRKHREDDIDDLVSFTDTSASSESEDPSLPARSGILRKHFDKFMGKFEEPLKLFKDYSATSKEALYRDTFLENEDRLVVDEKAGVFAVFDGMGGGNGGALAADIATEVVARRSKGQRYQKTDNPREALDNLTEMIEDINTAILNDPDSEESGTTATAFRLVGGEGGVTSLAWVNVGDSRLYVSKKGGLPEQVTTDEIAHNVSKAKQGSVLTNCLGWTEGAFRGVSDSGILEVGYGDRIILCTDGVTGDQGSDLLSASEIHRFIAGLNAKEAAQSLIENARKIDDRTAVVVDL